MTTSKDWISGTHGIVKVADIKYVFSEKEDVDDWRIYAKTISNENVVLYARLYEENCFHCIEEIMAELKPVEKKHVKAKCEGDNYGIVDGVVCHSLADKQDRLRERLHKSSDESSTDVPKKKCVQKEWKVGQHFSESTHLMNQTHTIGKVVPDKFCGACNTKTLQLQSTTKGLDNDQSLFCTGCEVKKSKKKVKAQIPTGWSEKKASPLLKRCLINDQNRDNYPYINYLTFRKNKGGLENFLYNEEFKICGPKTHKKEFKRLIAWLKKNQNDVQKQTRDECIRQYFEHDGFNNCPM